MLSPTESRYMAAAQHRVGHAVDPRESASIVPMPKPSRRRCDYWPCNKAVYALVIVGSFGKRVVSLSSLMVGPIRFFAIVCRLLRGYGDGRLETDVVGQSGQQGAGCYIEATLPGRVHRATTATQIVLSRLASDRLHNCLPRGDPSQSKVESASRNRRSLRSGCRGRFLRRQRAYRRHHGEAPAAVDRRSTPSRR